MNSISGTDEVFTAARIALDGLSARQQAISQNIANVDTPGYRAQTVTFDEAVRQQLVKSNTLDLARTQGTHLTSPTKISTMMSEFRQNGSFRADGNNVDIDTEMMDLNETALRYDTVTQLANKRYRLIKEIIAQSR